MGLISCLRSGEWAVHIFIIIIVVVVAIVAIAVLFALIVLFALRGDNFAFVGCVTSFSVDGAVLLTGVLIGILVSITISIALVPVVISGVSAIIGRVVILIVVSGVPVPVRIGRIVFKFSYSGEVGSLLVQG